MRADDAGAPADLDVLERAVGAHDGVLGDRRGAEQLDAGQERDVGLERDRDVDPGRGRVDDRHPLAHPAVSVRRLSSAARSASWARSLAPSVCATSSVTWAPTDSAVGAGDRHDVGEVVLPLGVVVADPGERVGEEGPVEGVDAGVDLADRRLASSASFCSTIAATSPSLVAHDPAVAEGVGDLTGQHRDRAPRGLVVREQVRPGSRPEQRGVAGHHHDGAVEVGDPRPQRLERRPGRRGRCPPGSPAPPAARRGPGR